MIFFLIFISFCELKKSKWRNYSVCPNNIIMMLSSRTHKTNWQCGYKKCQDDVWVFRYFANRNMGFSNSNVLPTSFDCNGCAIGQRTQSDRTADAIWSGGEREPIGWRTEADWVANGNRSDGERNLIGRRVPSRGCTCLKCTNKVVSAPTKQYWYSSCFVGAVLACLVGAVLACLVGALETSAPPKENAEE